MRYKNYGSIFILRLDAGEEIISTLVGFCTGKRITLGTVQGIGAVGSAEIGLFETRTKEYHKKTLRGDYEITSLLGSITMMKGQPYLHLHATLSDASYHAFGGHLSGAVVSGTCEIFIHTIDDTLGRRFDEDVGLNVLDL
jgi:predicted DNA-binding protein with PD1-like motif